MVGETIQQGSGQLLRSEGLRPFVERQGLQMVLSS